MPTGDGGADLLWDVAMKTALVLAVLYGVLWAVRRAYGRGATARRGPAIQLLQSAHLGPGRSVHLLGVGDRVLLVGATSQQVSLLAEIADTEGESVLEDPAERQPFDRYLRQAAELAGAVSARLVRRPRSGDERGGDRP